MDYLQHRDLAGTQYVARTAHLGGRIHRHDLAGDQPIEQVPQVGKLLLTVGAEIWRPCSSIQPATCTTVARLRRIHAAGRTDIHIGATNATLGTSVEA